MLPSEMLATPPFKFLKKELNHKQMKAEPRSIFNFISLLLDQG